MYLNISNNISADDLVQWKWVVVFIPAFIVDAILLILIKPAGSSKPSGEVDEEGKPIPKQSILSRLLRFIYIVSFVAFQILVALKLDDSISINWAGVFIPLYVIEAFHFVTATFSFVAIIKAGKYVVPDAASVSSEDEEMLSRPFTTIEKLIAFASIMESFAFRVALIILFIVRLDNPTTIRWAVVFLPCYLYGVLVLARIVIGFMGLKRMNSGILSQIQERRSALYAQTVAFVVVGGLIYTFIILLCVRVDNAGATLPLASVILFPVFLILSLLFCCVCW
jgi:hypothetical protein